MDVRIRQEGDMTRLEELVCTERNALQRDRYRAVLLALRGEQTLTITRTLGRSRRGVQDWVYAYRDGGIEALLPGQSTGRPVKLPREKEAAFKQRVKAGPAEADGGVCTLRGEDLRRILEREFGVSYTLQGVYDLLDRLNLSCLAPRPRHRGSTELAEVKNDPEAMRQWLDSAPPLSKG